MSDFDMMMASFEQPSPPEKETMIDTRKHVESYYVQAIRKAQHQIVVARGLMAQFSEADDRNWVLDQFNMLLDKLDMLATLVDDAVHRAVPATEED